MITIALVTKLIQSQFPHYSSLPIHALANAGWDNYTFRLGENMLIRLPRDAEHAPPILKEFQWLPILSKQLTTTITTPVALGEPSTDYPWHWVINQWVTGETASDAVIPDKNQFAKELALFLNEFHAIDASNGPKSGAHNFYRGGELHIYDKEMQHAIFHIKNSNEKALTQALWQDALASRWEKKPVWVHGDLAIGNILVENGHLKAIIDFGQLAVGDPACDLVIAWNFLSQESRVTFKNTLQLDKHTWLRALGWACWKTRCWPVKGMDVAAILHAIHQEYLSIKS
jgi:aminoglycoside phosphotransferase (APT) family kinase protein